jgi:hypothetical protein
VPPTSTATSTSTPGPSDTPAPTVVPCQAMVSIDGSPPQLVPEPDSFCGIP